MVPEQDPQAELVADQIEVSIPRNSIAVLPFADLSAEGNQQFFTDGLSEELLNLLVRIDGLKVDHFLVSLHDDPRWRPLLEKMNLLEYWDAIPGR